MYPNPEHAYFHERERRKDQIRKASNHNLTQKFSRHPKPVTLPIAVLSIIAWLLVTLIAG